MTFPKQLEREGSSAPVKAAPAANNLIPISEPTDPPKVGGVRFAASGPMAGSDRPAQSANHSRRIFRPSFSAPSSQCSATNGCSSK